MGYQRVLTGGEFAADDAQIEICVGTHDNVCASTNVTVQGLQIELEATTSVLSPLQKTQLTARVTTEDGTPVSGVPVSFTATRGGLQNNERLTDATGTAIVQFTAGLNPSEGTWSAQVGYAAGTQMDYSVRLPSGGGIDASKSVLLADETQDGTVSFDLYGVSTDLAYETQATLTVQLAQATQLQLGDLADPNLEPLVSFALSDIDQEQDNVIDDHLLVSASINDITQVHDHPLGRGRSASFDTHSRLLLEKLPEVNLLDNLGLRLEVKPLENGVLISKTDGRQTLEYQDETLRYRVETQAGTFTVSQSGIAAGQWHRVATRVQNGKLELYVNGEVTHVPITGTLLNGKTVTDPFTGDPVNIVGQYELGGAKAIVRGFKIYDWSSQPLVALADGSDSQLLDAGSQDLTIKSLGNLGQLRSGSQLKTLRVAVVAGGQRNYLSLMTKNGYQAIGSQYLTTISPQSPFSVQYQPNPLAGLVPTAHAWSWNGVWEGVVSSVGLLIPYEDFISIGEQLVYLANRDWENFDAATLAFASMGAATIIPLAKPLKPLLGPAKKMVDFMKRFPASKHFAGAIGSAVKLGLNGKTEKLANLVPFIEIAVVLYEEPEVFEFVLDAIESEDDLWVWVDYFAAIIDYDNSEDVAMLDSVQENPIWIGVHSAYAQITPRRQSAQYITGMLKQVKEKLPSNTNLRELVGVIDELTKGVKNADRSIKGLLKSGSVLNVATMQNARAKIRYLLNESKKWRVNRWLVLAALGYVTERTLEAGSSTPFFVQGNIASNGATNISDEGYLDMMANIFTTKGSDWYGGPNGYIFQLMQIVYYDLLYQYGGGKKIIGIEQVRGAYFVQAGIRTQEYKREIDIVLGEGNEEALDEEWIELKSLSGPFNKRWFVAKLSGKPTGKERSYYKQFFHDMRLNAEFINDKNRGEIIDPKRHGHKGNVKYQWLAQDFKAKSGRGTPPTEKDISNARNWLCATPTGAGVSNEFLSENISVISASALKTRCLGNKSWIDKTDIGQKVKETMTVYADKLDVDEFLLEAIESEQ